MTGEAGAEPPLAAPKLRRRRRGPGRPFPKGQNSHDGQIFRRGLGKISRGSGLSIYRAVMEDDGELAAMLLSTPADAILPPRLQAARTLILALRTPGLGSRVLADMTDRLDGRPRSRDEEAPIPHVTVVWDARDGPPPGFDATGKYIGPGFRVGKPGSSPENDGKSAGDRAALPPRREIPRAAGTVFPPRQADGSIRV